MTPTHADGVRETGTVLDRIVARPPRAARRGPPRDAASTASQTLAAELPGAAIDFAARLREGARGQPRRARACA